MTTRFLHVVMDLNGDLYSPELNGEQMTDLSVTARDIAVGEWPGEFKAAAFVDYAGGAPEIVTDHVLGVIEAVNRSAA
ncbi:MAG: hypothetical protein JJ902_03875 [Roseibium sp.]|nr:hypothetical protein [Roseibium sp.]